MPVINRRVIAKRRGTLGAIAMLTAAATVLTGCSGDQTADTGFPEKLGLYVAVPMRGPWAAQGQAVADGVKLALNDSGGGITGRSVRLSVVDTATVAKKNLSGPAPVRMNEVIIEPEGGSDASGKILFDRSAILAIGGVDPTQVGQMIQLSAQQRTGFIAATGGLPDAPAADLQPGGKRTYVSLAAAQPAQATQLIAQLKRRECRSVLAVMVSKGQSNGKPDPAGSYSSQIESSFERAFSKLEVVKLKSYADPAAAGALRTAKAGSSECVAITGEPVDGDPADLINAGPKLFAGKKVVVSQGAASLSLATLARKESLDVSAVLPEPTPNSDGESRKIEELYKANFGGRAPYGVISGWRAAKLALASMKSAGIKAEFRSVVASKLVGESVGGPPVPGTQDSSGQIAPQVFGLARPVLNGWRVTRTLSGR